MNEADLPPVDAELVDASGLRCPLPVIRAAQRAVQLQPGGLLRVISTDPASEFDLPAWARMRGHQVLSLVVDENRVEVLIRLG